MTRRGPKGRFEAGLRPKRLARQIHRELDEIVRYDLTDPLVDDVRISRVRVSPDLRHVTAYFVLEGNRVEVSEVERHLAGAVPEVQSSLAERISFRYVPALRFKYDRGMEEGNRVLGLLDQLAQERRHESRPADRAAGAAGPGDEAALRDAVDLIHRGTRFVLASHVGPDGDSLGSQLGLGLALEQLGKEVVYAVQDAVPDRLAWLPGAERLLPEQPEVWETDVVVTLECPSFERVGRALDLDQVRRVGAVVLNIDHHSDNQHYGAVNLLDFDAAAAGVIVLRLIDAIGIDVTPEIATALYVAVLTDTGSFHYANTTASTFEVAARLVRQGADPSRAAHQIYHVVPLRGLRLLADALQTLWVSDDGNVAGLEVSLEAMERRGARPQDTEGFVNYARQVEGVKIGFFLREEPEGVKLSLRSVGDYDVQETAKAFGGGGHRNAAGALLPGPLPTARQALLDQIRGQFGFA